MREAAKKAGACGFVEKENLLSLRELLINGIALKMQT